MLRETLREPSRRGFSYLVIMPRSLFLLVLIFELTNLHGQVPVHKEPRHHVLYQNKEIRILNVIIAPGDTTLYHIHSTPSLFIFFTETFTGSQLMGGKASNGRSTPGNISFENLAAPNIRTHRVWNADKDIFHVIDVELLSKDSGFDKNPLTSPDLKLEINNGWARAYRLVLPKENDFMLENKKQSFILVSLNESTIQTRQNGKTQNQILRPGSFFEIKSKHSFNLRNISDNTIQFFLLELPVK